MDEIRDRMKGAGVWLPYTGQSPEEFFLPLESFFSQTLTRLCYLLKDICQLGFSIDHVDREGVLLRWTVAEQEVVVEHHYEPLPDAVPRAMAALLAPLNASLHEVAVVVVDCAVSWSRCDYNVRLIVADPHRAQALRRAGAAVWGDTPGEHCEGSGLEETELLRLPLPDELVPEAEYFLPGGPYGQAFACMTESLADRLGLDLTALPFPNRPSMVNLYGDARTFPITIQHSFLQTTCKVDHSPDDEGLLQVLEELQERVELENSMREDAKQSALLERKPYWLVVGPGSEQLVFATASQAKELRACGYLREGRHRRRLIEAIEHSGEPLPDMIGTWRQLLPTIGDTLERIRSMVPKGLRFAVTTTRAGDCVEIVIRTGDQIDKLTTDPAWLNLPPEKVLQWLLQAMNGALMRSGGEHRLMMIERRILWLRLPWVLQFVAMDPRLARYLEPDFEPAHKPRFPAPLALPEAETIECFAATRLPSDIVGPRNLLESDFKSSCREEDYPSVFEQIAKFAGVGALCPGLAIGSDDRYSYTLEVTLGESVSTIVLANKKYPDVTPVLDYLNGVLEACERPRRLHVYRTPGTGDGVLLASEREARELAHLRYIEGVEIED